MTGPQPQRDEPIAFYAVGADWIRDRGMAEQAPTPRRADLHTCSRHRGRNDGSAGRAGDLVIPKPLYSQLHDADTVPFELPPWVKVR